MISYPPEAPGYRPGVCNIGPDEIARRRRSAMVLLAVAGIVAVVLLVASAPAITRWIVLPPLSGGLISYLQVRRRFCVAFGALGVRNLGRLGAQERVADAAARAADRRTALRMVAEGTAAGAVLTSLLVLLPV